MSTGWLGRPCVRVAPRPASGRGPGRGDRCREADVIAVCAPGALARPGRCDVAHVL